VWLDILSSQVLWRSMDGSGHGSLTMPSHIGAVLPTTTEQWLLCLQDGIYLGSLAPNSLGRLDTRDVVRIASFPHRLGPNVDGTNRMRANDAKVDARGVGFFGTMPYDPEGNPGTAALYVLDQSNLRVVIESVTISNGIGWSPDGETMYYVDSPTGRVDRCIGDAARGPLEREPFAVIDSRIGIPDGLTVDSEGFLWVAIWGGSRVMRIAPDGSDAGHIEVPCPQTTSCAFIGEDLRTLLITTAGLGLPEGVGNGQTYAVELPVPGLPQPKMRV
jgi:sugar lactone lactonase YvrE